MANIAITDTEVIAAAGAQRFVAIAGVAVAAGKIGYLDPADSFKAKLGKADGAGLAHAPNIFFLNNAAIGQPVEYVMAGAYVTLGSADKGVKGEPIIASATSGLLCPTSDYATGMYHTLVMYLDVTKKGGTLIFANAPESKP